MREKLLWDEGWRFHPGEIPKNRPVAKGPMYSSAKTERERWGGAAIHHNDNPDDYAAGELGTETWQSITLPHDFVISGAFSPDNNSTLGYLPYGVGWYRRHFRVTEADRGRRLVLCFEAVANRCTVYCNGSPIVRNHCGYNSFFADITDFVRYDTDNVLAVYVDATEHEGWWYEGGGIYRHVWLTKTDPVHVAPYGVFVKPRKTESGWCIEVETELANDGDTGAEGSVTHTVYDRAGNAVGAGETGYAVAARDTVVAKAAFALPDAHLWDPDDPYLYTCETTVYAGETPVDRVSDRFGCRTFVCDPDKGLLINGRHVKIRGVCGHYDCGLLGKAVPDNVFRYKVRLMREMGANGYRTSHYPQAEALMDAFDEAGFIVMDETRWFSSAPAHMAELAMLVKRDRNHPCVFFWSVGNEEFVFTTDQGRRIAASMMALVTKLDPTRPVTAACDRPDKATIYDDVDVIGVNYNLQHFDMLHAHFPDKAIFSSENCATGTTRGWYNDDDPAQGYISAYDAIPRGTGFMARELTWKYIAARDYIMGGYQWIAFEHRGETVWPRLCSQSGAIDLFLQKKDAFWQNKSHWTTEPMVHLLPHWNFRGREDEPMRVSVYTNCTAVELFLNEKTRGIREVEPFGHAEWTVPYMPGTLKAIGYRDGKALCTDSRETTGRAVRLHLSCDNPEDLTGNGQNVVFFTCTCLDAAGREVPDATAEVRFAVNHCGKIVATGSDISDHAPLNALARRMRAGRITVAVQMAKAETGETLRLYAESDTLESGSLAVQLS